MGRDPAFQGFQRGPAAEADQPGFDDSNWATVQVPHDWAIAGPYEPEGDPHTGNLPWRGEGWYRRHFVAPPVCVGTRFRLEFDGVMANPTVSVNGHAAGGWDYGYSSFAVDITDFVRLGLHQPDPRLPPTPLGPCQPPSLHG